MWIISDMYHKTHLSKQQKQQQKTHLKSAVYIIGFFLSSMRKWYPVHIYVDISMASKKLFVRKTDGISCVSHNTAGLKVAQISGFVYFKIFVHGYLWFEILWLSKTYHFVKIKLRQRALSYQWLVDGVSLTAMTLPDAIRKCWNRWLRKWY